MALTEDNAVALIPEPDIPNTVEEPSQPLSARPENILDPGFNLTLRPMKYPQFFEMYKDAIKNTWTVDEIDFSDD